MRRVLVDYARSQRRAKRGRIWARLELDGATGALLPRSADVLALDEALERLTVIDERKARIIELRFFGGSSYDEIGAALGLSSSTVKRELEFARAWLASELAEGETERG